MFQLLVKEHFNAAHSLRGYQGKCANIHGHTWIVEILVAGNQLDELGMIIDFGELKKIVKEKTAQLDHQYINELAEFGDGGLNPTAENIARYLYRQLQKELANTHPQISLLEVKVWESNSSCAVYKEV